MLYLWLFSENWGTVELVDPTSYVLDCKDFFILSSFAYWLSSCINLGHRWQQEAELKLIEEETARRVEEAIRKKVNEALNSEEVKKEIEAKIKEGRNKLFDEIAQQLAREKEDALAEARRKEVRPVLAMYMV